MVERSPKNECWQHTLLRKSKAPIHLRAGKKIFFGRHSSSDIRLSSQKASRRHAMIEWFEGMPRIVDLKSNNGVYVNDERISARILQDGDKVRIANLEMTYQRSKELDQLSRSKSSGSGESSRLEIPIPSGTTASDIGYLHHTSIAKVLSRFNKSKSTGILNFLPDKGQVAFDKGQIIWAFANELKGEPGLLEINFLERAMFVFQTKKVDLEQRNIFRSFRELKHLIIYKEKSTSFRGTK